MKTKKNIEIIPNSNKEHQITNKCWCRPKRVYKDKNNGNEVWVHFIKRSKRKKD